MGDAKEYRDLYRRFCAEVELPADFLDRKLSTIYARHFYGEEERAAVRDKWVTTASRG
ncbi:MAG: hypothetical protein R2695_04880 [Acidimicrobiales bacterium]